MARNPAVPLALLVVLASSLSTHAAAQNVPTSIRVEQSVMAAQVITKIAPEYPAGDRVRIQGSVVLRAIIDKQGNVANLQLISGHPILAPSAIEAVKQWKYKPYLLDGKAVEVETTVTVNFTLANQPTDGVAPSIPGGIAGDAPAGSEPARGTVATPAVQAAPQPGAVPQRVRVSSRVAQGLLATKIPPGYPQEAKDRQIQGLVVLKVIIDKEGNVAHIELVSGDPLLSPAALDAVKQWKYKPYLLNQSPVEVETQVQVNFTLAG